MRKLELAFLITFTACASWLAICCAQFVTAARKEITSLDQQIAAIQTQVVGTRKDLDAQLGAFNSTALLAVTNLGKTSNSLLKQTGSLQRDISVTLAGLDNTTSKLQTVLNTVDTTVATVKNVVVESEVPALVKDSRMAVGQTALTMAHVRGLTNTLDQAAPAIAKSVERAADATAGITVDVHKITTDVTKPKKWYVKAYDFSRDFANLLRWIP